MNTVLIDYGAGNLHSVHKALKAAGFKPTIASKPSQARHADTLILPGQGHFRQVMHAFLASGFESLLREHIGLKKPFLGICVGLQLLMEASEEAPSVPGLGIFKGKVKRFPTPLSVPQIGWNQLTISKDPKLLKGLANGDFVYFANSYYVDFQEKLPGSLTSYGTLTFQSSISNGPVNATQFHPEKSQSVGIKILKNFHDIALNYMKNSVLP